MREEKGLVAVAELASAIPYRKNSAWLGTSIMIDRETPLAVFFTLIKTQDCVETSVLFDNDICPTISASGVSLSITIPYNCADTVEPVYSGHCIRQPPL